MQNVFRVIAWSTIGIVLACASVIATSAAPASQPATIDVSLQSLDPDESIPVIITLRSSDAGNAVTSLSAAAIDLRAQRVGLQRTAVLARHPTMLTLTKGQPTYAPLVFAQMKPRDLKVLATDPDIAAIQPDWVYKPALYESTSIIGSATANAAGYAGAGTSVAVLDTGVLSGHEFLSGQVVEQACFSTTYSAGFATSLCPGGVTQSVGVGAAEPCADLCDHGTHVAGIIAGKKITYGGQTFSGVAPAAKIIAVQVFSRFETSACGDGATGPCVRSYTSDQIRALDWLYSNRASGGWGTLASINMSLGGGKYATMASCDSNALKSSVDALRAAGIATVIASGNEGLLSEIYAPACISSAIAVGASTSARTGTLDDPASFSNRPSALNNNPNAQGDRLLDLMAPGNEIMSSIAASTTSYDDYPGTSMAAPHVAGAWAVLKGISRSASVSQVLGWLRSSGNTIVDSRNSDPLSIPRINVGAAVTQAVAEMATATRTPTRSKTPTKTRTPTRTAPRNPKQSATKTRTRTRTGTRTSTATQTALPSLTSTKTPLPAWATSVTNGGFEGGFSQTEWTESSVCCGRVITTAVSPILPRHGTYFAWLGGDHNEISILSTTLSIPVQASYLRLYTFVRSDEKNCANDIATIKLNSVLVSTIPLCYATNSSLGYIAYSIDVTALRGQSSVPLEIKVVTNSVLLSHFLVDDVGYVSAPTDSIYRFPLGVLDSYTHPNFDMIRPKP